MLPTDATTHVYPDWLADVLALAGLDPGEVGTGVRWHEGHSNDIGELRLADGRVLLLKRGRHDWTRASFAAAAAAARLIAAESDITVPEPLDLDVDAVGMPLQAYWLVPLPTLAQVWPVLSLRSRAAALRSAGRLLRRLHGLETSRFGALHTAGADTLAAELDRDLRQRLLPAVYAHWPAGLPYLESLIEQIPEASARCRARPPVLVHNDPHIGNVLCRTAGERVECVGFLDLDDVVGGVKESDVASFDVLHGRLFEQLIEPGLRARLVDGYGEPLDPWLVRYFRRVHLINQGFSAGLLEHHEHAGTIAAVLDRAAPAGAGAGGMLLA
jgi:aminoglycoside phosphotransferase (APT) family kinase protein